MKPRGRKIRLLGQFVEAYRPVVIPAHTGDNGHKASGSGEKYPSFIGHPAESHKFAGQGQSVFCAAERPSQIIPMTLRGQKMFDPGLNVLHLGMRQAQGKIKQGRNIQDAE